MTLSRLLLIGGRSGVGKSTVAFALNDLLSEADVRHAVIEGDVLDLAYPEPWELGMAEQNLQAMWANYRAAGYRRLIYTNTVSVLESAKLAAAMGDAPVVTSVQLQANDDSIAQRLRRREDDASLSAHLQRSKHASAFLEAHAGAEVHRVVTDGRSPSQVAREIHQLLNW